MIECSQYSKNYCFISSQGICSQINPELKPYIDIINGECISGPLPNYEGNSLNEN